MFQDGKDDFLGLVRTVLIDEISAEKANNICFKLSDIAGGAWVYIGKMQIYRRSLRNNLIREDHKKGYSIERLAKKYKLSTRQILRII